MLLAISSAASCRNPFQAEDEAPAALVGAVMIEFHDAIKRQLTQQGQG